MKILYIQHTAVLGGSSKSLLELISNLPDDVEPYVLCPNGPYSDLLKFKGINVFNVKGVPQFDNTQNGYYRGVRWLILFREFFLIPFLIYKLVTLRKYEFDVVHVNDSTQIYSIIISKLFFKNVVVHVRALQCSLKNLRYKILNSILEKYSSKIIAIDNTVKNSLDNSLNVVVIHNGMTLKNIHHSENKTNNFRVAIVANFQRYKGILEFLDAADYCINNLKLDIDFYVFGASYNESNSVKNKIIEYFGFRENIEEIIFEKIKKYKLKDKVILKGFTDNLNNIYNNIDLLTFPSHLNAVGRPVFEAAFYKIPSIVAIDNPLNDTIEHMKTGLCIKEKDYFGLAEAIFKLQNDRELLSKLGENAHQLANSLYNSELNAKEVYNIYKYLKV